MAWTANVSHTNSCTFMNVQHFLLSVMRFISKWKIRPKKIESYSKQKIICVIICTVIVVVVVVAVVVAAVAVIFVRLHRPIFLCCFFVISLKFNKISIRITVLVSVFASSDVCCPTTGISCRGLSVFVCVCVDVYICINSVRIK
jgi:hypothetical protein